MFYLQQETLLEGETEPSYTLQTCFEVLQSGVLKPESVQCLLAGFGFGKHSQPEQMIVSFSIYFSWLFVIIISVSLILR